MKLHSSFNSVAAALVLCVACLANSGDAATRKKQGLRRNVAPPPGANNRHLFFSTNATAKSYGGGMGGKTGGGKTGGKTGGNGKTGKGGKTGGKSKGGKYAGDDDDDEPMDMFSPPGPAPTEFPTVSRSRLNEIITCIAVIDESNGSQSLAAFESRWTLFRENYPDRPFCLLQPLPETPPALFIPEAFLNDTNTIYSQVSRDQGVELDSSDWFDICSLDTLRAQGVVDFAIFIDNSGSLTTPQVQASFDLLLERASMEGLTLVSGIENAAEDWISPFLTDFE